MKLARVFLLAVAAIGLISLAPARAQACDNCGSWSGLNPVWGFGFSGNLYGLNYIPVPPYFALHPPVYYGEQVYRTYGTSPFAARPSRAAVEVQRVKPAVVVNPFVPQSKDLEKKQEAPTVAAQEIINPYVVGVAGK